jgi:hypothetical protein
MESWAQTVKEALQARGSGAGAKRSVEQYVGEKDHKHWRAQRARATSDEDVWRRWAKPGSAAKIQAAKIQAATRTQ